MVRIGCWGAFDPDDAGDLLDLRVLRYELSRRVPGLELRVWAPSGATRGSTAEGDELIFEPLGVGSDQQLASLAGQIDVLVIGGRLPSAPEVDRAIVGGLGAYGAGIPTAWHGVRLAAPIEEDLEADIRAALPGIAYVGVADEASREVLSAIGAPQGVQVVPDAACVIERLVPPEMAERRVAELRHLGVLPAGDFLVLQGDDAAAADAEAIAERVRRICKERELSAVLLIGSPGDRRFAERLGHHLPELTSPIEYPETDVLVSVIAWSAGSIGVSPRLAAIAASYGRPHVGLSREGDLVEAFSDALAVPWDTDAAAQQRAVYDGALDALAGLVLAPEAQGRDRDTAMRLAEAHAAAWDRERELTRLMDIQGREIIEKVDIRFTRLWRRMHEADRHYNFHKDRADRADERERAFREEVAWLKGVLEEREAEIARMREAGPLRAILSRLRWSPFAEPLARLRGRLRRDGS